MAKRRRRKIKRWLYFPIALVVVLIATPIFLHFAGDGAKEREVVQSLPEEQVVAEPTPTPVAVPDRLFAYFTGEKWGYKDQAGRTYEAIPQTYDQVQAFSEDRAFVGNTVAGVTMWSLIDSNGQVIADNLPYSEVRPFSGGYAAVKSVEGWGFIDADGLEVISPKYDMVGDCSVEKLVSGVPVQGITPAGLAPVGNQAASEPDMAVPTESGESPGEETGALNTPGVGAPISAEPSATPEPVAGGAVEPAAGSVECGLAVVGKNNIYGYVAPGLGDDPPAIALAYASASAFGDRMAFVGVKQADGSIRYSIIDNEARPLLVIDGQGSYFSDLMAPVRRSSNQYVYYDARNVLNEAFIDAATGEAATFEDAKAFADGLGPVKIDGLWGYIGKDSAVPVIPPQYRDAMPFSEGLAVVQNDEGQWGAIDMNGQTRIAFQYDELESFEAGYALGRKMDTFYAVSLMGEEAQLYIRSSNSEASGSREMVVQLSQGTLNVRAQASTDSAVLTFVENGTRVAVLGEEGEWSQVSVPGNVTGYIKTEYLREP